MQHVDVVAVHQAYRRRRPADHSSPRRGLYSADEVEFMTVLARYKRENRRMNPDSSEVLALVLALGYVKQGSGVGGQGSADPPVTPDS